MAAPIDTLIETLIETRAKLEEELGRIEAYRALRQLEQREASGERLSIVPADQLRQKLEAELAGNHYLNARRKLDEALALLGNWGKGNGSAGPAPPALADVGALAPQPAAVAEPVIPVGVFPSAHAIGPASPSDDLSLIRDLPSACVSVIAAAGYGRYRALAEIDSRGVAMLERLLGQPGIIARGNWIEQAAILATGRETRHAARLIARRTGANWPPAPAEPDILPAVEMPMTTAAPAALDPRLAPPHDLTSIRGIDATVAARLAALGVGAFADIAGWSAPDIARLAGQLEIAPSRIGVENWIEQAAMLALGRATRYLDARPVQPQLAPMPPEIVIAAELVEAEPIEQTAIEPAAEAAQIAPVEPILVELPANDDIPPAGNAPVESPEADSPFWTAASGKPTALRPVRKNGERSDNVFDDVAALVARTVETARNVGGMKERPKRPEAQAATPAPPPKVEVPFRSAAAAPPKAAAPAAANLTVEQPKASPAVPPVASAKPAEPPKREPILAEVAIRAASPPPAERPRPPTGNRVAAAGFESEAAIEIRPRASGASADANKPKSRGPEQPRKVRGTEPSAKPASGSTPRVRPSSGEQPKAQPVKTFVVPRAPGTPRGPLAASQSHTNGDGRQTIVIDELSGRRAPSVSGAVSPSTSNPDMPPARLGALGRFVKALRGD